MIIFLNPIGAFKADCNVSTSLFVCYILVLGTCFHVEEHLFLFFDKCPQGLKHWDALLKSCSLLCIYPSPKHAD
jgi:hypothetical protein